MTANGQPPWHVFLPRKNHDKTDIVYRLLAADN